MFWDILDGHRKILLEKIVTNMPIQKSYLAGGTALALMIGHRDSIDFDWFTQNDFSINDLVKDLQKFGDLNVSETKAGTFHGYLDGINITWLHYPNPLIAPLIHARDLPSLRFASKMDLALMKWAAISDRGSRKDFVDLYFLSKEGFDPTKIMSRLSDKFPGANINYYHMVKSLAYFEDAEFQPMPNMKRSISWLDIKTYFLEIQAKMIGNIEKYLEAPSHKINT